MARRTIIKNRFDGGISDDIRQQSATGFAITKHFDIYSNPFRLSPYRSTEADTNDGSTSTGMKQYDVRNFQYGSDGKLYGVGIQPSSATRQWIFYKTDPTTGNWTVDNAYKSSINTGVSWRNSFLEWQGKFWSFGGTTKVINCPLAGTYNDNVATVGATITHVAQSVIAPDNNMYMFYNNIVVRVKADSSVVDNALVLPSDGRITNACLYGKYMAIAWASGTTLTAGGRSKLFLWDLVSSDVTDAIDFGEGQLMIVGNIEGQVIGISDLFMSATVGLTMGSVVIRRYSGGTPVVQTVIQMNQNATLGLFRRETVVKGNRIFFTACLPFNGSTSTQSTFNLGIWSFGRKTESSPFALTLDYVEEAVDPTNYTIVSFGNAGNYWFINHSVDGSITKTDDSATYSFTSYIETEKLNFGDINKLKKLSGIAVSYVPLGTTGQVVVKYRVDSATAWTTVSTNTTDNDTNREDININSTGSTLAEFSEMQLRIESTGGAEITSYKLVVDDVKTLF